MGCSDTSLAGALVEVGVYGYILLQGANLLSDGSELLLEVVDPGIIGCNPTQYPSSIPTTGLSGSGWQVSRN